jgi:hypothetical protein
VQVESFNNFEGFYILRLLWHLEFGYIFSSFLAIEGPCIAKTIPIYFSDGELEVLHRS